MLSYRLRFSQKPLRFAVNDLITPLTGFYVYLALLAFYALFLLFPVNWFGRGFLGVYGRPMTLGLYAFVVITTLSVVVRERHGERKQVATGTLALWFFIVLLFVLVLMSVERGHAADNPYLSQYQQGVLTFVIVTPLVYYAIPSQEKADRIVRVIAAFVGFLTLGELVGTMTLFLPVPRLPITTLEFQYVIPFAALYFYIAFVTASDRLVGRAALFAIAIMGCLGRLLKPVVVPLFFAMVVTTLLLIVIWWRDPEKRVWTIVKRILVLAFLVIAVIGLLELVLPGSFLGDYRLIFYARYLKADPTTGQAYGRLDGGRLGYYGLAWQSMQGSQWLGGGLGTAFQHPSVPGRYAFPHSLLLDFFLTLGVFGLFVLAAGLLAFASYLLLNVNWRQYQAMKLGLAGYLLFTLFSSLVSNLWPNLVHVNGLAVALGIMLKLATLDGRSLAKVDSFRLRLRPYRSS